MTEFEDLTGFRRRVWSDLFAAVVLNLIGVALLVVGVLDRLEGNGPSGMALLGAVVIVSLGISSWARWARSRARLHEALGGPVASRGVQGSPGRK